MMSDIKIGIVIVNWNDCYNTLKSLDSAKQKELQNPRIVVIDNHSSSKDINNLYRQLDKNIRLIVNNQNYGLSYAVNKGIKYLLEDSSITHVMWLNSEGRLARNFFEEVIPFIKKNKKLGIIGIKNIYRVNSNKLIPVYGMYVAKSGYANMVIKSNEKITSPVGTVTVYSRDALESVKIDGEFLPSRFFLYAEDLDLGIRIQLAGYKWKLCKTALAYHSGWSFNANLSNKSTYYLHRNILWFTLRCFPNRVLIKNLHYIILAHVISLLYYCIIKKSPLVIVRAKYDSLKNIRTIWQQRKNIQKKNKISDSEFEKILSKKLIH